jgi:hypothetical protein
MLHRSREQRARRNLSRTIQTGLQVASLERDGRAQDGSKRGDAFGRPNEDP